MEERNEGKVVFWSPAEKKYLKVDNPGSLKQAGQ